MGGKVICAGAIVADMVARSIPSIPAAGASAKTPEISLNIANQCSKAMKQVLILSDGEPYCNGTNTASQCLTDVAAANWQQIPVNTIYIASDTGGISFMQQLAAQNNGTFFQPN